VARFIVETALGDAVQAAPIIGQIAPT